MDLSGGFGAGLSIVMMGAVLLIGGHIFGVIENALPCSDRTGYATGGNSTGSAKQCLSLTSNIWSGLTIAGIGVIMMGLVVIFAPLVRNT